MLDLEPGAEVEPMIDRMRKIPGVGEWTAQYIAMRALSWPDAFPHTDYGVLKAMGENESAQSARSGGRLATVARLCRHASLEFAGAPDA